MFEINSLFSATIKLNSDIFIDVSDALSHLKNYCDEKFIIEVGELMNNPMHKIPFDEYFKRIVQK